MIITPHILGNLIDDIQIDGRSVLLIVNGKQGDAALMFSRVVSQIATQTAELAFGLSFCLAFLFGFHHLLNGLIVAPDFQISRSRAVFNCSVVIN